MFLTHRMDAAHLIAQIPVVWLSPLEDREASAEGDDWAQIVSGGSEEVVG
jgi:hypothetical protein